MRHPAFDINAFNMVNGPGEFHDVGLMFLSRPYPAKPARLLEMQFEARAFLWRVVGRALHRDDDIQRVLALAGAALFAVLVGVMKHQHGDAVAPQYHQPVLHLAPAVGVVAAHAHQAGEIVEDHKIGQIGRASCRERV